METMESMESLIAPLNKLEEFCISLSKKKDYKSINKIKMVNLYIKNILNIFMNDSTEDFNRLISTEIMILNKEILSLNEIIEELRNNYWDLKQILIKDNKY